MRNPSFTTSFADLLFKYFSVGPDILIYGIANIARFSIQRLEKMRKKSSGAVVAKGAYICSLTEKRHLVCFVKVI